MNLREITNRISCSVRGADLASTQKLRVLQLATGLDSRSSMRYMLENPDYEFSDEDGRLKIVNTDTGTTSYLGGDGSARGIFESVSDSGFGQDIKESIDLPVIDDSKAISDEAVSLSPTSSDEEQLQAYESLLGHLQPLYYPMYEDTLDDLVQDFWGWMNHPQSYQENVASLKNIPSGVKVWAIRWLQNLNRGKHFNSDLSARFKEELNRASGHINLSDYIDEAYNRIFAFSEKELVSFIRKFKELMKTEKGEGYALTPHQITLFTPLFEKAQFLLQEERSADCVTIASPVYSPLKDSDEIEELDEPLVDLLGSLFYEVEGSELSEPLSDSRQDTERLIQLAETELANLHRDLELDPEADDADWDSLVMRSWASKIDKVEEKLYYLKKKIKNILI